MNRETKIFGSSHAPANVRTANTGGGSPGLCAPSIAGPKRQLNPGPAMPLASEPGHVMRSKLDAASGASEVVHRAGEPDQFTQIIHKSGCTEAWSNCQCNPDNRGQGKRHVLRCMLPQFQFADKDLVEELEAVLIRIAGGFTRLQFVGGWRSEEQAEDMTESGLLYECSVTSLRIVEELRRTFIEAGKLSGQTDLHMEVYITTAFHVRLPAVTTSA